MPITLEWQSSNTCTVQYCSVAHVLALQITHLLSRDDVQRVAALGSELDPHIEAAVRHSMAVAQMSVEPHKALITKNCQRVSGAWASWCRNREVLVGALSGQERPN